MWLYFKEKSSTLKIQTKIFMDEIDGGQWGVDRVWMKLSHEFINIETGSSFYYFQYFCM